MCMFVLTHSCIKGHSTILLNSKAAETKTSTESASPGLMGFKRGVKCHIKEHHFLLQSETHSPQQMRKHVLSCV